MIDWKILASAFIALLVVSFILMGDFGADDFLSGAYHSVSDWFGSSPFGEIIPVAGTKAVNLTVYPKNITLRPVNEFNIDAGETTFNMFRGNVEMDFEGGRATLYQEERGAEIFTDISGINMTLININSMKISGIPFSIEPDMESDNGTIEITGFLGSARTTEDSLIIEGNATTLKVRIGEHSWEIDE